MVLTFAEFLQKMGMLMGFKVDGPNVYQEGAVRVPFV